MNEILNEISKSFILTCDSSLKYQKFRTTWDNYLSEFDASKQNWNDINTDSKRQTQKTILQNHLKDARLLKTCVFNKEKINGLIVGIVWRDILSESVYAHITNRKSIQKSSSEKIGKQIDSNIICNKAKNLKNDERNWPETYINKDPETLRSIQQERPTMPIVNDAIEDNMHKVAKAKLPRRNTLTANCRVLVSSRISGDEMNEFRSDITRKVINSVRQNGENQLITTKSWPQEQAQQKSKKANRQKIAINCGQISENLPSAINELNLIQKDHDCEHYLYDEPVDHSNVTEMRFKCVTDDKAYFVGASGISLLERVIKSHPIWFLPGYDRSIVVELLRRMELGMFIVRDSSRNFNSNIIANKNGKRSGDSQARTMALSVRVPPSSSLVNHYVIEPTADGCAIRLESSPFTFKSLPLLIQHYCLHGDELPTRLRLPRSIFLCESSSQIDKIARLGREFWVSEHLSCDKMFKTLSKTARLQEKQQDQQLSQQQQLQQQQQQERIICFREDVWLDDEREEQQTPKRTITTKTSMMPIKTTRQTTTTTTKRMPAIVMHNPIVTSSNNKRQQEHQLEVQKQQNDQQQQQQQQQLIKKEQSQCCSCHCTGDNNVDHTVPKHQSPIQSITGINSDKSYGATTPKITAAYRNDMSGNNARTDTLATSTGQSCWYVNPSARNFGSLKKSQSALDGFEHASISSASSRKSREAPSLSRGANFLKNLFSASSSSLSKAGVGASMQGFQEDQENDDYFIPLQSDTLIGRDNSLTRRAKTLARRILPFVQQKDADTTIRKEYSEKKLSQETIRARQLAFRRCNTDLGNAGMSAAKHLVINNRADTAINGNTSKSIAVFRDRNISAKSSQAKSRHHDSMIPPGNSCHIEKAAIQNCIEELQRKRLQSVAVGNLNKRSPDSSKNKATTVVLRPAKTSSSKEPEIGTLLEISERRPRYEILNVPPIQQSDVTVNQRQRLSTLEETHPNEKDYSKNLNDPSKIDSNSALQQKTKSKTQSDEALLESSRIISNSQMSDVIVSAQISTLGEAGCSTNTASDAQVLRHSIRTAASAFNAGSNGNAGRYSSQSSQRHSKIATVRPQQHMILNSSSSSENGETFSPENSTPTEWKKSSIEETKRNSSQQNASPLKHVAAECVVDDEAYAPFTSTSSSVVSHTANDEARSSLAQLNTMHSESDDREGYAHVSELQQHRNLSENNNTSGNIIGNTNGEATRVAKRDSARVSAVSSSSANNVNNLDISGNANEEDTVSVAGTDFNEPWDSTAWNNLLDLARFGDEKPTTAIAIKALHSTETIIEEDDLSSPEDVATLRSQKYADSDEGGGCGGGGGGGGAAAGRPFPIDDDETALIHSVLDEQFRFTIENHHPYCEQQQQRRLKCHQPHTTIDDSHSHFDSLTRRVVATSGSTSASQKRNDGLPHFCQTPRYHYSHCCDGGDTISRFNCYENTPEEHCVRCWHSRDEEKILGRTSHESASRARRAPASHSSCGGIIGGYGTVSSCDTLRSNCGDKKCGRLGMEALLVDPYDADADTDNFNRREEKRKANNIGDGGRNKTEKLADNSKLARNSVEMEAAAMAVVLGGCGPRPVATLLPAALQQQQQYGGYCVEEKDERISAAAKLAASTPTTTMTAAAIEKAEAKRKQDWLRQRNRTFRAVVEEENCDENNETGGEYAGGVTNNNRSYVKSSSQQLQSSQMAQSQPKHYSNQHPQQNQRHNRAIQSQQLQQQPHRLKSSQSFSMATSLATPAGNKTPAASVSAAHGGLCATCGGGGGPGGGDGASSRREYESASLGAGRTTNSSYDRRRRDAGHVDDTFCGDSLSLQRMPHYDDVNDSMMNNLSIRVPSLSPVIAQPRFRQSPGHDSEPSEILQRYVEQLASDESTLFGGTLHKFIECTVESEETDPHVVVRRVRQFLNGMKNYLVKNGQGRLHALIERESAKLNANEFLNIDAIFESVLTKIVLVPIKGHLYHLMVFENTRNGQLQRLSENLSCIRAMDPAELGFAAATPMPDAQTMEQVRAYLRRMQNHFSPLKKLENLLKALSLAVCRSLRAIDDGMTAECCDAASSGGGGGPTRLSSSPKPNYAAGSDAYARVDGAGAIDFSTLDSRITAYSSSLRDSTLNVGGGNGDERSSATFATAGGTITSSKVGSSYRGGGDESVDPTTTSAFAGRLFKQQYKQSAERLTKVDASGAVTLSTMAKRLPGEDLIRWLVYLLAKTSAINCEIEAWYMWELLPQQLLTNGEAAYYLSMLFSAVNVLKNPDSIRRLNPTTASIGSSVDLSSSMMGFFENGGIPGASHETSDAFLRIAVPNEHEGSISYHTFPVLPQMNVSKLCRVIAHQFAITNPEDYGLYVLYDNYETVLLPNECPQAIHDRLIEERKTHLFAYKRKDMRIAWPKNAFVWCMPAEFQPRAI